MDIVCSIKHNEKFHFFEADYFTFMLNLSREDNLPESFRHGIVSIKSEEEVNHYISFLKHFKLDFDEIQRDYESLSSNEKIESDFCFFPTILIDFKEKKFYSSHPESSYLGFERYLLDDWQYVEQSNVITLIPSHEEYWHGWDIPNSSIAKRGSVS